MKLNYHTIFSVVYYMITPYRQSKIYNGLIKFFLKIPKKTDKKLKILLLGYNITKKCYPMVHHINHLVDKVFSEILNLCQEGKPIREISSRIWNSKVNCTITDPKYKNSGSINRKAGSGRRNPLIRKKEMRLLKKRRKILKPRPED